MNQPNGNNGHIFEFGKFVLDPNERVLFADGEPIHLTDKVFDTLHLLVRHNRRLLSKERMMASIWEESFVEEGNLAKNISRLRKILNVDDVSLIETVPRRGYRFAADVKELDSDTSLLIRRNLRLKITQTEDEENGRGGERETGRQIESSKPKSLSRVPMAVAACLLAIGASSFGLYLVKSEASQVQAEEGVIRLTNDPASDGWLRWTQDGRIRFFRVGSDKRGINMSMNADGTDQTEAGIKGFPNFLHWSPDGSKILFSKPGDTTAKYLANADGSNEIALPLIANTDWSADSKKIVYQLTVGENKNSELFIYSIETGEIENVTNHPGFDADPNFSPDGTQIAFVSGRDGNAEVYLMNSDGSNVRRLTNHPAWDNHPSFSPDGTTIAFTADRDNESADVYFMNADGSNIRRMTDSEFDETVGPGGWSPDGTQIAFYSDREGNDEIYVMSAEVSEPQLVLADEESNLQFPSYSPDGEEIVFQAALPDKSGEVRIYDTESKETRRLARTEIIDLQPIISPDGSRVVFHNRIGSNTEICSVSTEGGEVTNLTQNPARDISPSFSHDGKQVAFVTNRDGNTGLFHLYVMNADGSGQHRVYLKDSLVFSPSWSPSGRGIVFSSDITSDGNFDLYALSLEDPERARQLTFGKRQDAHPAISPDGSKIAYASVNDGNWEIYLMNFDGTGLMRLTRHSADDFTPQFSKDGSKIIFSSNRTGKWALHEIYLSE